MSVQNCAIILLASGLSNRFGAEDKLLARLIDKSIIDHTLEAIAPVGFGACFAVIGALTNVETALRNKLTKAGYQIIVNPAPENGQGSSLALGAQAAIDAGFHRACVALADMPCVPSAHFTALLDLAESSDQVVSETESNGRPTTLPPCVFSGDSLLRLTQASGDVGAKRFLRGDDITRQMLSNWAAQDIDTLDDLEKITDELTLLRCHAERMKTQG